MSYLVSDLMQETKRSLLGMHSAEANVLNGALTTSSTTVTFQYPLNGIARGSYLAVEDEIVYVWSATPGSQQVTVQRGMLGTSPAAHDDQTWVDVNPRYANFAIRYALREEIRSWGPRVYAVKSTQIQTVADVRGYDLQALIDDNFYYVISVRRSTPTFPSSPNAESWPKIKNWQVIRNAPTADFPSACGLVIPNAYELDDVYDASGTWSMTYDFELPTLNVVYAYPFDVDTNGFADDTDLITGVGLDETMIDIPPIGAAWRLLQQRESLRVQTEAQGQPTDLQLNPPMYASRAAAAFKNQRDSRLGDVQIWLMNRYGIENWGL